MPNYEQRVNAFNAQDALIQELADKFEASGFNAKSLFADMVSRSGTDIQRLPLTHWRKRG